VTPARVSAVRSARKSAVGGRSPWDRRPGRACGHGSSRTPRGPYTHHAPPQPRHTQGSCCGLRQRLPPLAASLIPTGSPNNRSRLEVQVRPLQRQDRAHSRPLVPSDRHSRPRPPLVCPVGRHSCTGKTATRPPSTGMTAPFR
jgi:hypothetical protein